MALLLAAGAAAGAAPAPGLDPGTVPWTHLDLAATRFPFSATSTVDLAVVPPSALDLRSTPKGSAVPADGPVVRLAYRADLLGQKFSTSLWMRGDDGAALQYETVETGRRQRQRVLRFTNRGVALWTVRPAAGEADRPPADWSDRSTGFRPYEPPAPAGPGLPVADPLGLLYVVAAAGLGPGREQLDMLGLAGRDLVRIQLRARPAVRVRVDYVLRQGGSEERCRAEVRAVPVAIHPVALGGVEPELDFLGLSSDILVLVEEGTRLPVQVTGRAHVLGSVKIRLHAASLRDGTTCRHPGVGD